MKFAMLLLLTLILKNYATTVFYDKLSNVSYWLPDCLCHCYLTPRLAASSGLLCTEDYNISTIVCAIIGLLLE
jgi:hypothetical protein